MKLRKLFEATGNEVALIFGRFNPPHKGHRAAWEIASQSPVWYVGTNKSTVGAKDPLPFDIKVEAMKTVWPEVEGHVIAETSWLTAASMIYKKHGDVTLLCLTDEDWVTKTIKDYNGKEGSHGYYNFPNIEQKPTPRLSSATALRDAVSKGDRDAFTQAAGVDADTPVAGKPFFDLVAEYLLPYQNTPKKAAKKKEPAVAEGYPKHQDLSGVSTDKLKAYLAKQSQQQVSGEGNQVKRVRAELQRREQGVAEVSKSTLDRYVSKAVDAHGDADFSARMSKNDPDKRSYHVDQKKTAEKRRQGISRALDRMSKEGVEEGEGGFDIEDMVMDQYRNGNDVWEIAQYLGIGEDEVQDIIDSNGKGVAEATPETTVSALRGYKTWQVWIKNNYYNGKYPDYSGRPYRVIAGSADEARQVVLDNADRVLKDLLSKKFPSGKRVLPPKSALPIEAKHIGAVDDGTMKGQVTTSRPITMLSPQGPMTVMLDAGNIVDVERDVEEGKKPEHNLGTGWMLAKDKELGKKVAQNTDKARREKEMMQKYAGKKDVAEADSNVMANTAKRLANKDDGKVAKLRAAGDKRREDQLKGKGIAKRDQSEKDEWGNYKRESIEEARQSAQVRLAKAWDKQKAKSAASRERAKELLNPSKQEPKKDSKTQEDAAGVGIITKQNTTKDVNKGTLRKMMKGYKLI